MKKIYPRKFFVKDPFTDLSESSDVFEATIEYFEEIHTRIEAMAIGLATYGELHRQMLDDYIHGSPAFIGTMKITTGLERTLSELDKRFPELFTEIHAVDRSMFGRRLARC